MLNDFGPGNWHESRVEISEMFFGRMQRRGIFCTECGLPSQIQLTQADKVVGLNVHVVPVIEK